MKPMDYDITKKEAIEFLKQVKYALLHSNSWLPSTHNPIEQSFDMAIEALSASITSQWILCSEKLPKESDGKVLVTHNGYVRTATHSEFSNTWYHGDFMSVGGNDPIAWMPLPEPYKAEGVDKE